MKHQAGKKHMRMGVTQYGARELTGKEATELRIAVSNRMRERQQANLLQRRVTRLARVAPERRTVERAMLAVEEKFVKAMWVLELANEQEGLNYFPARHGIDYLIERIDHFLAGSWQHVAPRAAIPEGRHIDEAEAVKRWLLFLQPMQARVLSVGAMAKRGDAGRRVPWIRERNKLPELAGYTIRTIQGIYAEALRTIVSELTLRSAAA